MNEMKKLRQQSFVVTANAARFVSNDRKSRQISAERRKDFTPHSRAHCQFIQVQLEAARSEAHWTPRSVE